MEIIIRKAISKDADAIWAVIQEGIARRKKDGSTQWQDGYPNPEVIRSDIERGVGFVMTDGADIVGYIVILTNDEPAYEDIKGQWLSEGDYIALHRIAIADSHSGKGLSAKLIGFAEEFAVSQGIFSVKADTNHDNLAMSRVFEKMGYQYCGTVFVNDGVRNAYEKILK